MQGSWTAHSVSGALALGLLIGPLITNVSPSMAQGSGSGSSSGAQAKGSGSGSGSHAGHPAAVKGDTGPSSQAYAAANEKMHKDMDITFSGDADVDFVKGMIPHHAGAVDMAKIVLQYGKDDEVKKLAAEIIKAQETEIAWMREWLKKKGK